MPPRIPATNRTKNFSVSAACTNSNCLKKAYHWFSTWVANAERKFKKSFYRCAKNFWDFQKDEYKGRGQKVSGLSRFEGNGFTGPIPSQGPVANQGKERRNPKRLIEPVPPFGLPGEGLPPFRQKEFSP